MRKFVILFFLLMTVNSQAHDGKGNFATWGAGNKSCYHYYKDREDKNDDEYKYFIMGYLTAYNKLTPKTFNISGKMTINDIIEWLDNYCEMKKLDGFEIALDEYVAAHMDKRQSRSPRDSMGIR